MTRMSLFNSPLLLGFDEFERALDRITKASSDGYPPYNIERVGDDNLRITLAVAGFTKDDLSVAVEDNQLAIRGKHAEETGKAFLHRGIAARQFQKSFVLAEGIKVVGASLDNGLLSIDLERPERASSPRTVEINAGKRAGGKDGVTVSVGGAERKAS
ncbi:MAG TPA: Hsp20 family protein [Alphaproteobacteria bacterium]|nr:Hsp20 family protein [Alphaproteobacteria bacterium]